ncbi:leucine-rich repeat-containing protein 43-like [Cololabis saira]|uniref:leucine-rich repeat-containing protein 43-like n=1 Tax=Cololabis saira TaxID=129043 RepID=UPI002AD543E0|nr:leucine-rich repeat-containing protein 43-like [Cololabis saira]
MASKTLSAVLEKKIRRLDLNSFPCGNGPWRKTKDSDGPEKESVDDLLRLLNCPPRPDSESWSRQASALRELAVRTPQRLNQRFIYTYFTTLHIVDEDVSVIDDGLLKFSKLEELVLSANYILEIPWNNLPRTLKILELRANRLSSLDSLSNGSPPQLQYLSLASNSLGSNRDAFHLTGIHWPLLVCLDISDCEFQDLQALLEALSTLSRLKTVVLEGNPFTLSPAYPGLTVDSLPQLDYLDCSWISRDERHRFRGLADMRDLIVDTASVTVTVGKVRGIPDPLMSVNEKATVVSYSITYDFLTHDSKVDTASMAHGTEPSPLSSDLLPNENFSQYTTSKRNWSDIMDFCYTQTFVLNSLSNLKKFFNWGLYVRLEEEKVLVPASSEVTKSKKKKDGTGKKSQVKPDEPKDKHKKKEPVPEAVEEVSIRRVLGSARVPLQSLIKGGQKVQVLCNLDLLHTNPEVDTTQTLQKAGRFSSL